MSLAVRTKVKPPSSVSVTYSLVSANVFVAKVGWTPAVSAWPNSYHVLYRDDVELATSIPATTSIYRDTGVAEGEEHVYTIGTVNVNEVESEQSDPAALHVPSYPVWQTGWSVSLDQGGSASIAGFATDPEGGSLTFSRQGGTAPATVTIASNGTVSVGASAAGGSYTLIIRATNAYLSSDTTVTMVVTVPISAPGTPSFAVAATSSSATLGSWAPTAGPAPTSYEMDRSLNGTSGWTNVFTGLALSAADTGLSANTQYFYRLRAFNGAVPSGYATANTTTLAASGGAATWIVAVPVNRATFNFDGSATSHPGCSGPSRAAQPGDILEFAAGNHGRVNFSNISSAAGSAAWTANPFIIRNSSQGVVTFRSPTRLAGGFHSTFKNCFDITLNGGNCATAPEHPDWPGQTLGIKWMYSPAATTGAKESMTAYLKFQAANSTTLTSCRITLRNFEIDGGWWDNATGGSVQTNGIGIQVQDQNVQRSNAQNANKWQEKIRFLYGYVHNVEGEGLYFGANFAAGSLPLRRCEVGYFRTYMTGNDGINVKSWLDAFTENSVHDFHVERACAGDTQSGTPGSVAFASSGGLCYNGEVVDCGLPVAQGGVANNGAGVKQFIQNGPLANSAMGPGYPIISKVPFTCFNVISRKQRVSYGFTVGAQSGTGTLAQTIGKLYNLAAYDNADIGIRITSEADQNQSFIKNCISVGNTNGQITGPNQSSNTTTGTAASIWDDPDNGDFHLRAAILASGTIGIDIAPFDLEGTARVLGSADRGPLEF